MTPDGFAMTNSHVVHGRRRLRAVTPEGDALDADLVGDDPATDLALLRMAARDLPFATLGDSESLQVGQLVIAMGNPFGFQSTVFTGVISALGRAMCGEEGRLIENIIQHTAPLTRAIPAAPCWTRGRVIGINTAIVAMAQGLGFAVPAKTAKWVLGELIAHGRVRRLSLGITATVTPLPGESCGSTISERSSREGRGSHPTRSGRSGRIEEWGPSGSREWRIITGMDDLRQSSRAFLLLSNF